MGQIISAICGETFEECPPTTDRFSNRSYQAGLSNALKDVFCSEIEEKRVLFQARGDYYKRIKQIQDDDKNVKGIEKDVILKRKQIVKDYPKYDQAANSSSVVLTRKQSVKDHIPLLLTPKDVAKQVLFPVERNEQIQKVNGKDKGIQKDVILTRKQIVKDYPKYDQAANNSSVVLTRKQSVKDHIPLLLPPKVVEKQVLFPVERNEQIQKVNGKDKGIQKDVILTRKQVIEDSPKNKAANNSVILTRKQSVEDDITLLTKDKEKHVLSLGRGMYSFRFQQNQQLQEVDRKDEEKHAFFQVTPEIGGKDEEQLHVFFQSTGKYINKLEIPTRKQNVEYDPPNKDAINKIEIPTNKQIFEVYGKDEAMNTNVSVKESLSMKREIMWLKHYNNGQKILLVGEGDFSFSASLVMAFGSSGSNITATSLDSADFLRQNYKNVIANIEKLTSNGATVMHRLDATTMSSHPYLRLMKFDRIIYNFPYFGFTKESPKSKIQKQKKLVRGFLSNAKELIKEDGEIHITHKTNGFHLHWDVNGLALLEGLCLVREVDFNLSDYPGYETKYGFGGDNNFDSSHSKTYMWRFVSTGIIQ